MPRTGITPQQIRTAAQALADRGQSPTVMAVRAELGRGSPNTIAPVLAAWRAERQPADAAPPPVPALIEALVKEIWETAYRVAEDRLAAERERHAETGRLLEQARAELVAERRARASLAAALAEAREAMARQREPVVADQGCQQKRHQARTSRQRARSTTANGGTAARSS